MRFPVLPTVAMAALLVSCGPAGPGPVRPDPALLALVPADTVLLAGVRLDALRQTVFYKKHLAAPAPRPAWLQGFIGPAGIDLRTGVREMLAASDGKSLLLLSRGQFAVPEVEERLEKKGAKRTRYKGRTLIGNRARAVVFLNSTTAVAAAPARLRAFLDHAGEPRGAPAALREMLKDLDGANQLWLVALGGRDRAWKLPGHSLSPFTGILQRVERLRAGAQFGAGIVIDARGECASAMAAESLQSALRAIVGLVELGARGDPAVSRLMEAIAVSHQDRTVAIRARLSPELAGQLFPAAEEAARPDRGPGDPDS